MFPFHSLQFAPQRVLDAFDKHGKTPVLIMMLLPADPQSAYLAHTRDIVKNLMVEI